MLRSEELRLSAAAREDAGEVPREEALAQAVVEAQLQRAALLTPRRPRASAGGC